MYKLVAFDCDGTLLNDDKRLDDSTIKAIGKLREKGLYVVLASSRPFCKLKKYLETLNLLEDNDYTVSFNGSLIISNDEKNILHSALLSSEAISKIISYSHDYNLYVFLYEENRIISNKECLEYVKVNSDIKFEVKDLSKIDVDKLSVYKIIIHGDADEVLKARLNMESSFNNLCLVTSSNKFNIEFIPLGNSKAKGLSILGKKLNVSSSEMIAFGDNENDIEMFNYVGYKVAMGNGTEELKKIADKITKSNNDNGIAVAIQEMINEGII